METRRFDMLRALLALALASASLSACPTPSAPRTKASAKAGAAPVEPAGLPSGGAIAPGAGNIIGNNGSGIISNNSAKLLGVVRAPAGIISNNSAKIIGNNGAGIIGNNGGGIIGNNGASFRLLAAIEQKPLAHATVRVLDAAGKPVLVDGKPLTALTDAEGRYGFTAAIPDQNLILEVALAEGLGAVRAVVPKGAATQKVVDADLVSTLTTGYIMDQYVKGQPDPVSTLERLPAEVELDTRKKAQAALEGGATAVPAALTTEAVVATVNALRREDSTFDGQMEAVRKLLIPAGLSDLGSGQVATEVDLGFISDVAFGADGAVYFTCPIDLRVWKLRPDGKLVTAAGKGTSSEASQDGKPGPEAELFQPSAIAALTDGGLAIVEVIEPQRMRISRLTPDGKIQALTSELTGVYRIFAGAGGAVVAITRDPATGNLAEWTLKAGQAPAKGREFTGNYLSVLASGQTARSLGGDVFGITSDVFGNQTLVVFPGDGSAPKELTRSDGQYTYFLDTSGRALSWRSGRVDEIRPDGSIRPVAGAEAFSALACTSDCVPERAAFAPDGTVYLTNNRHLLKLAGGRATVVAGRSAATPSGSPSPGSDTVIGESLERPTSVLPTESGAMLLLDVALKRVGADRQVTQLTLPDYFFGHALVPGKDGSVYLHGLVASYMVDDWKLLRLSKQGEILETIDILDRDYRSLVASSDGQTLYYGAYGKIYRFAPGGEHEELFTLDNSGPRPCLAIGPGGALYVVADDKLRRWTAAGGVEVLKTDPRFTPGGTNYVQDMRSLAVDPQGRCYLTRVVDHTILRFDPAQDRFETIAGPGGKVFTGTGVNDSLLNPTAPLIDAEGNLLFCDMGHKQVKRVPADRL